MKHLKPIVLVILDGWGESDEIKGNAIKQSKLNTIKKLEEYYPKMLLQASGVSVGLPYGEAGNSEVGHQSIGSGLIIYQNYPRITLAIENGQFAENPTFLKTTDFVKEKKSNLHILGLLSDGAVHSHINHLFALLDLIKEQNMENVFFHIITDGRDTEPKKGIEFIKKLQSKLEYLKIGKIATICGRYYAMDRNNNYDRIEKAYKAMVEGEGIKETDPVSALEKQYAQDVTDEFIKPIVIVDENQAPVKLIKENDGVIFFNYREDRARQITKAFIEDEIKFENLEKKPKVFFTSMTQYEKNIKTHVAFPPQKMETPLGKVLSENGKKQLRIAETEKYAHVTYFFNTGKEKPFPEEDHILIPSKNVSTYDKAPEMSAQEITDKLIEEVDKDKYDFILVNYANPDMVGHTGNLEAAIKGIEKVDECLNELIKKVLAKGGCLLITADHGNADEMINITTGEKLTEHSSNPVPFWIVTPNNHSKRETSKREEMATGFLSDIAPTVLKLMGIKKPQEMTGESLLKRVS